MAAYSVLVSLSQTLTDFIQRNPHQVLDRHRNLFQSLQQNVIFLQGVFDRLPRKVSNFEEKIYDFANEAELIIEDYISRTICDQKVSVIDEHSFFRKIGNVGATVNSIVDQVRIEIELVSGGEGNGDDSSPAKIVPGNQIHQKQRLFGFEHQFSEIKDRILNHLRGLQIVPIVGMGGIGKTSLAKAIFDDKRIASNFDLRRWVKVSASYKTRDILFAILGVHEKPDEVNVIELGVEVNRLLFHRRYLIVIDDVWDLSSWDEVQKFLRDDENRSRVLLTTRHRDVAHYAKPTGFIHHLQLMDENSSWRLLKYKVFGEEDCPSELVEIGRRIANECSRLPLAIVAIAGILTNVELNRSSWENIAKDVKGVIRENDDDFMDILALSYQHLPHYLRPCFLYISAFVELDEIEVSVILKHWVAERFIKVNNTSNDVEETAYECLSELIKRNLVVSTKIFYDGRTTHIRVHDLVKDLSKKKAQEEKFLHCIDNSNSVARRVSFIGEECDQLMSFNQRHLRSIISHSKNNENSVSGFHRFMHLRLLHAPFTDNLKFPSQLLKLHHLRYLHLAYFPKNGFKVPSEIYKLENLESFIISLGGQRFIDAKASKLPIEIWKMSKLRHISCVPPFELQNPTGITSPLVNLSSLGRIRNFRFTKEATKLMPNLVSLELLYEIDYTIETWSDYYMNNICNLIHLKTLILTVYSEACNSELCKNIPLMKILAFPLSLKVLSLKGSQGSSWEDLTRITGSLPNLEFLELSWNAISGDIWETNEEDFQKLKVIDIVDSCMKCWRCNSSNPFPCLERINLIGCPNLTEVPDGIGDLPNLKSIRVDDQQKWIVDWAMQIKEEQAGLSNLLLQIFVSHVSTMDKDIAALMHEHGNERKKMQKIFEYGRRYGKVVVPSLEKHQTNR